MIKNLLLWACLLVFNSLAFSQNTYTEVSLPELMKKKRQGDANMVIVDVRTRGEYGDSSRGRSGNIGRINGAINVVLQDLQQKPESLTQLEAFKEKDIYLICSHSYRSRTASNILLRNGFTHVNNVRGGMTEWYRRYDELAAYRDELYDKDIRYKNLSPSQLLSDLDKGSKPLLLGIRNQPRFWWDSANARFYQYFPLLKNTLYFEYADSLRVLEEVNKDRNRPVILFAMVNSGAAELADWLVGKGLSNVYYLVGGTSLLYEYASNLKNSYAADRYFANQSDIRFLTPAGACSLKDKLQWIDLRHDSLFNKVNEGVKHNYKHLAGAVNYYHKLGADQFEKDFPDKKKEYVLINEFSSAGIELADAIARRGYKISWLTGGYDRWEWYMNNVEDFKCNDQLQQ